MAFGEAGIARLRISVGGRELTLPGRSAVLDRDDIPALRRMEDTRDLPLATVVGFTRDGTVVPAG